MRINAARMDLVIKIVTGFTIALCIVFLILSTLQPILLIPAAIIAAVTVGCYLRAPVVYEISPANLVIVFRLGSKEFGPVLKASRAPRSTGMSFRLFGNGGLFAGTGIFWNSQWGIYRAYVTTSKRDNMVLIETQRTKVLISPDPDDVDEILRSFGEV
jgi:hypothetical protein